MKTVLLTGARGFIGQYFINYYKNKYNIKTFSFLKDNFENLDMKDIEIILHLSALVHQMNGAGLNEYEKVNIMQTLNLARKAKENNVKQFIFMSSIAVYGIEFGVLNENTICNPLTDYGKTKLTAEIELKKLEDNNFKISIVRPPIVNGYNAPGNMKNLIDLVQKMPILPFGNINNKRSMIYVGNLCFFIDIIIQKKVDGIFLVSDEKPLSVTKLIELIGEALGRKVYLVKVPFFKSFLKLVKPSLYKRLYESLEVSNTKTILRLFHKDEVKLPFSVEEGIILMVKGLKK